MKKIIFLFSFVALFFDINAQVTRNRQYDGDCHQIQDSFRLRLLTLSTPDPWEPILIPYVVEKEGEYYAFFTKQHGTYCEMLTLQGMMIEYQSKIVRVRQKLDAPKKKVKKQK